MIFFCSSAMPIPVSSIEKIKSTVSGFSSLTRVLAVSLMVPDLVNFTAFPIRFRRICRIRASSSSRYSGTSESISRINFRPFSLICCENISVISSNTPTGLTAPYSSCIFPASILEISKISLISVKSDFPLARIMDKYCL